MAPGSPVIRPALGLGAVLALFGCLGLAGCAGSVLGDAMAGPEAVADREAAYCASMGFQYGTPQHADCRLQVAMQRQQLHHQTIQNALSGAMPRY